MISSDHDSYTILKVGSETIAIKMNSADEMWTKWFCHCVKRETRWTLTIACSILLSMATTLAPDELRKRERDINETSEAGPCCTERWRVLSHKCRSLQEASGPFSKIHSPVSRSAFPRNPFHQCTRTVASTVPMKGAEQLYSSIFTYCRVGRVSSLRSATTTETRWRNASAGRRLDP